MIEGIKPTVTGAELVELCKKQVAYHRERLAYYTKRLAELPPQGDPEEEGIGSQRSPQLGQRDACIKARMAHAENATELDFISKHLVADETYLLARVDLHKLGLAAQAF